MINRYFQMTLIGLGQNRTTYSYKILSWWNRHKLLQEQPRTISSLESGGRVCQAWIIRDALD